MDINTYGAMPGVGAVVESTEVQVFAGRETSQEFGTIQIKSTATDSGSTPTTNLRAGLLMARITATGLYVPYTAAGTDGSQIAECVLLEGINMLDGTGTAAQHQARVLAKGILKSAFVLNLDNLARKQLAGRFIFDDDPRALPSFGGGMLHELNKAADYTVVAADNGTLFTASAAANFTLPTLAAGLRYEFLNMADSNMTVTSAAGDDIVWDNDAACDSLAFSTSSHKIGGRLQFESNAAGTKWLVRNLSPATCTVTAAT